MSGQCDLGNIVNVIHEWYWRDHPLKEKGGMELGTPSLRLSLWRTYWNEFVAVLCDKY